MLTHAQRLAETGTGTGGAIRNWKSYGHEIDLPSDAPEWWRCVLCDPQTSGGLLIACSRDSVPQVLQLLKSRDFVHTSVLGKFNATLPRVRVI